VPRIEVIATARAASDRVGPLRDGVLRMRVTRPAVGGEANDALRRLLARALGIAPSRVRLVSGAAARRKRYEADGLSEAELAARLAALDGPAD
jgi:uncharacterized protein YggU (UPF0235/DUF167 family)